MTEIKEHIINDPLGIHARPAGRLVTITKSFNSKITLIHNGNNYDAKSMLAILKLAAKSGEKISFLFEGEDEIKAQETICDFLKTNF